MGPHSKVASIAVGVQDPPLESREQLTLRGSDVRDTGRPATAVPGRGGTAEALLVFLIAVTTRLPSLGHIPHRDELNQVLAARALLESGTLEILPGAVPYSRAWGYTYLIAGMFRLFGESLVVARLPALVFGALLVTVVFLWVRSEAGRMGAWFAAILLTFSPVSLQLSQWVRFYTLYALLFLVACLLVYRLLSRPTVKLRTAILLGLLALVVLSAAEHLQGTTIIGLAGLGLWATVMGLPRLFQLVPTLHARLWLAGGLLLLAVIAIAVALQNEHIALRLAGASRADLWAEDNRDSVLYYHRMLLRQYPLIWMGLPLAGLVATKIRSRAALLCICVFGIAFFAHSLVAMKADRYIFYVLPLFFALWGIVVGRSLPWLYSRVRDSVTLVGRQKSRTVFNVVIVFILAGISLYPALVRPGIVYAARVLEAGNAEWRGWGGYYKHPNWLATEAALAPLVTHAEVVLASSDVSALYAIGRIDYQMRRVINSSNFQGTLPDLSRNAKMKIPVVSTPESLARIMACNSTGLVFIEEWIARREWSGIPPLVEYLDAHAVRLQLPEEWQMIVYHWQRPGPAPEAAECETLP